MNENILLKLSLVFSILGILIILFISETSSIDLIKISEITKENLDEKVRIQGIIKTTADTPELLIINIEDETGTIIIILFKNSEEIILKENQKVEVVGKVMEYKDQLEISVDQIKVI